MLRCARNRADRRCSRCGRRHRTGRCRRQPQCRCGCIARRCRRRRYSDLIRSHRDRADGPLRLAIESGRPADAAVRGLPYAARRRSEVIGHRVAGRPAELASDRPPRKGPTRRQRMPSKRLVGFDCAKAVMPRNMNTTNAKRRAHQNLENLLSVIVLSSANPRNLFRISVQLQDSKFNSRHFEKSYCETRCALRRADSSTVRRFAWLRRGRDRRAARLQLIRRSSRSLATVCRQ